MNGRLGSVSLLLLVALFMTGCFPIWGGLDAGLLSGSPCKAPCWQNLTPGQSTSADVARFIGNLSKEDWPGREERTTASGCKWIRLADTTGPEVNALTDLYTRDGKLAFIESTPKLGPTLKQVTDHFGAPESFKAVEISGPESPLEMLEIYYPAKGVAFGVSVGKEDVGRVEPSMRVNKVEYFMPGDLTAYFTTRHACSRSEQEARQAAEVEVRKFVQEWSGFGQIRVLPGN
jgi:hypothetical protein